MKLKTVFLASLASAAIALSASAATDVFSVNAVGFVNVTVPAGVFKIITNPLNQGDNTLPTILPIGSVPVNTRVYKYNPGSSSYSIFTMRGAPNTPGWSGTGFATTQFNPGEGFFIQNSSGSDITVTFVGEVAQGAALAINIPAGFSILAPHVPQSAGLSSDLGLVPGNNDRVYFFRPSVASPGGAYTIATFHSSTSTWSGALAIDPGTGQPTPAVGEGFFYQNASTAKTWLRSFSAN